MAPENLKLSLSQASTTRSDSNGEDWDSTDNALSFLVKVIQDEVSPDEPTPEFRKTIVSSCLVPLFSKLVIHLGAEDPAENDNVR